MNKKILIIGLITGFFFSFVFFSYHNMNAAPQKSKIGKYQVALTSSITRIKSIVIFEIIIDTQTGKVVSRTRKSKSDYR